VADFLIIFALTNLIFSSVVFYFLSGLDSDGSVSKIELFIYSLGIGPAFTTLILYYCFLILPHRSNLTYFSIIGGCYAVLLLIRILLVKRKSSVPNGTIRQQLSLRYFVVLGAFCLVITSIILMDVTHVMQKPVVGHDALFYGVVGKLLANEKSIEPILISDYSPLGFFYTAKNAPSFSLLFTWEQVIGALLSYSNDYYYKSTSLYFGLLVLSVQFIWLAKVNLYLAILGVLALGSGMAFHLTLTTHHLDSYRIFFLCISWIFLVYSVRRKILFSVLLLGIFSGLAAFIHSIGMIVACLNILALFIFIDKKFVDKLYDSAIVGILTMLFGGLHYVIDIFWGRGWILNKILR